MPTADRRPPTLFQSLKGFLGTSVEIVRTRLELFSTELEEERERLERLILLTAASVFCLSFGVLLVTFFVVAAFWDTDYRLAVLGGLALFYLALGAVMGAVTRRKSRHKPKLFSATLGELTKDYHHLSS
jgi:uncharacterized membrane protein YqjE